MNGQCQCIPGFSGEDCSEDRNACSEITAVSPSVINAGCGQTLLVSGMNFFGDQIYCDFMGASSGASVPATVISAFQVYCPVPNDVSGPKVDLSIRSSSNCAMVKEVNVNDNTCCSKGCSNSAVCDKSDDMDPMCVCSFPFTGEFCEMVGCAEKTENWAQWPTAAAGAQVQGVCIKGTQGAVSRTCGSDSNYGPITGSCKAVRAPVVIRVNTPSYIRNSQTRRKMYVTVTGTAGSKTVLFNSASTGIPVGWSTATFNLAVGEVTSLTFGTFSGDFWTFDDVYVTSWGVTKSSQGIRVVSLGNQVVVNF